MRKTKRPASTPINIRLEYTAAQALQELADLTAWSHASLIGQAIHLMANTLIEDEAGMSFKCSTLAVMIRNASVIESERRLHTERMKQMRKAANDGKSLM